MECERKGGGREREREREDRCNRVQRGEAGGREGWWGSAVKNAWSLLE